MCAAFMRNKKDDYRLHMIAEDIIIKYYSAKNGFIQHFQTLFILCVTF